MKENSKISNNPFSSSMAFGKKSDASDDETLKHINTYFINELIRLDNSLAKRETKFDISEKTPLLAAFAIFTGPNRAKKAIELALFQPLFNDNIIKNSNTILLLVSTDTIEVDIDEIGAINDYIQELTGYKTSIIMSVGEDQNLGEALALTIVLSQRDDF
jgi:cell division GTPase FtsZ